MGFSFKKTIGKLFGGGGGGGYISQAEIDRQNVAKGNGRMINGTYVAYSAADKAHVASADANKNEQYQDISHGSQLGYYFGEATQLGQYAKKRSAIEERKKTVLGEYSPLGV